MNKRLKIINNRHIKFNPATQYSNGSVRIYQWGLNPNREYVEMSLKDWDKIVKYVNKRRGIK